MLWTHPQGNTYGQLEFPLHYRAQAYMVYLHSSHLFNKSSYMYLCNAYDQLELPLYYSVVSLATHTAGYKHTYTAVILFKKAPTCVHISHRILDFMLSSP